MPLATARFDYSLPPELVAQAPAARRDQSRLLVVDRASRTLGHHVFSDLPQFLRADDILFRNDATVLPARLKALRPTGGRIECLLLERRPPAAVPSSGETWRCLVKPGRKLPVGAKFTHETGAFTGEILAQEGDGAALVRFTTAGSEPLANIAARLGDMPLPPYIRRDDGASREDDRQRYQTVYADPARAVAAAAPTAGLHFTPELLVALAARGVRTADLTLHVGLGTFRPIATATIEEHPIHSEVYEMPVATQRALFPPGGPSNFRAAPVKSPRGRRIAVGTTTARSIEDFLSRHELPLEHPHISAASIYLYPPRAFRGIDALVTNFHQPRSTLLCLVAAFLAPGSSDGIEWLKEIYAEAIASRYRFFSYGDAMLIL